MMYVVLHEEGDGYELGTMDGVLQGQRGLCELLFLWAACEAVWAEYDREDGQI